jgi:hypothetical protein
MGVGVKIIRPGNGAIIPVTYIQELRVTNSVFPFIIELLPSLFSQFIGKSSRSPQSQAPSGASARMGSSKKLVGALAPG